jgi:hypothetical protein
MYATLTVTVHKIARRVMFMITIAPLSSLLWLAFAAIFAALGCYHYSLLSQSVPRFEVAERPMEMPNSPVQGRAIILGMDIDTPIKNFASDLNKYIDAQNSSNFSTNLVSVLGYAAACLTALFSFYREIAAAFRPNDQAIRRTYDADYCPHIGFGIADEIDDRQTDQESNRSR